MKRIQHHELTGEALPNDTKCCQTVVLSNEHGYTEKETRLNLAHYVAKDEIINLLTNKVYL